MKERFQSTRQSMKYINLHRSFLLNKANRYRFMEILLMEIILIEIIVNKNKYVELLKIASMNDTIAFIKRVMIFDRNGTLDARETAVQHAATVRTSRERRSCEGIIKKILETNKNLLFDWIKSFVITNNNTFIRNKALRGLGYLIETEDYNFIIFSCKVQLHEYGYSIKS